MAAPIRSTGRSPSRPGRSTRWPGPTCTTPIRPPRSARIRNGSSRAGSSPSIPGAIWSARSSRTRSPAASTSAPPSRSPRRASTCRRSSAAMGAKRLQGRWRLPARHRATSRSPRSPSIRSGICRASRERFGCSEGELRRTLFEQTGGMFPELVTRPDMSVFLPPIGNITVYVVGDVSRLSDPKTPHRLPRPRRVQRLGRVRLRHLHLPALSRARHRGMRAGSARRRRRRHRL